MTRSGREANDRAARQTAERRTERPDIDDRAELLQARKRSEGTTDGPPKPETAWRLVALLACTGLMACSGGSSGGSTSGGGSPAPARTPAPVLTPALSSTNTISASEQQASSGAVLIGTPSAYAEDARGQDVTVAVIDSGIDRDHPEFAGRIDVDSVDIVTDSRTTLQDESGHGTLVAGIIAAAADGKGTVGVAPEAEILAVRSDLRDESVCDSPGCGYFDDDVAAAIHYAIDKGADIINLSIGKDEAVNDRYREALERAVRDGVLVTAAAGNEGSDEPLLPAAFAGDPDFGDTLIAVGAVHDDGGRYAESNTPGDDRRARHFLVAPGVSVLSTDKDGGYARLTGTSFSTPHVAGAAAVLKSRFPSLSMEEIAEILLVTARDLGARGTDAVFGRGLVDLERALQPQGPLSLPMGEDVDAGGDDLSTASLSLGAAFGDALAASDVFATAMALDSYARPYRVGLGAQITRAQAPPALDDLLIPEEISRPVALAGPAGMLGLDGRMVVAEPAAAAHPAAEHRAFRQVLDERSTQIDALTLATDTNARGRLELAYGSNGGLPVSDHTDTGLFLDAGEAVAPFAEVIGEGMGAGIGYRLDEHSDLRVGIAQTSPLPSSSQARNRLVSATIERQYGPLALTIGYRFLDEDDSVLGSKGEGALAPAEATVSHLATTAFGLELMPSLRAFGGASFGVSSVEAADGLLEDWSPVRTSAFSLGLVKDRLIDDRDRLGLLVSQPLRVDKASATLDLPVARDLEGRVQRSRERADLTPSGRELALQLAYVRALDEASRLGSWLLVRHEPGHDRSAADELVIGVRFDRRF